MSVKSMIKLANWLDEKYNLESTANTYDWSETVRATREGEQFGKNVEIPLPKVDTTKMKYTVPQAKSAPQKSVPQAKSAPQKSNPQITEGLKKIKQIKTELPTLRQAVEPKLQPKINDLSQKVNSLINKYKSTRDLSSQDLTYLTSLHKEVMDMKASILAEALKSFKTV